MLLYDTHAGKGRIVKPEQLIPGQAIKSLVVLENGDLLGGTTTGAATGGTRVASEAEIFRLSWPNLKVTARWKIEPSTTAISDLLLARNNLVFGLTANQHLFVIDPKTNKTLHTEQLLDYGEIAGAPGLQTTNVMVAGEDDNIYILFTNGIARVNIVSFSHEYISTSESILSGSLPRVKDTGYFASGAYLLSIPLTSNRVPNT